MSKQEEEKKISIGTILLGILTFSVVGIILWFLYMVYLGPAS